MIKYIVKVGYNSFEFDNEQDANIFARMAKTAYTGRDYGREENEIEVTIELVLVSVKDTVTKNPDPEEEE